MMKFIEKIKDYLYLTPLYDLLGKRSYAQSGEDIIAWGELSSQMSSPEANQPVAEDDRFSKKKEIPLPRFRSGVSPLDRGDWGNIKSGFYVDVGAYHPKIFSNTYLFYKKGWRGICVDPNPEMAELFRVARPGDVFLNVGVGGRQR